MLVDDLLGNFDRPQTKVASIFDPNSISSMMVDVLRVKGRPPPLERVFIIGVNRSIGFDSKVSLDLGFGVCESCVMISQPYQLYIERRDASRSMARYYAMSIEPNLFGEVCLSRRWGRIGAGGQTKIQLFRRESEAVQLFLDLLRQKRRRGYRPTKRIPN